MTNSNKSEQTLETLSEQITLLRSELTELTDKFHQATNDYPLETEAPKTDYKQAKAKFRENIEPQVDELKSSIENSVREQPVTAISIAAGIGFLIGLITRR